jgi:Ca2+-binding RTX toxin-like protein
MLISTWLLNLQSQLKQSSSRAKLSRKRTKARRPQSSTFSNEAALLEERILLSHVLGMAQQSENQTSLLASEAPQGRSFSPLVSAANGSTTHMVTFVDSSISDYQSIVSSITTGSTVSSVNAQSNDVYVLDGRTDGIDQITRTLSGLRGVSAVQVISHGSSGEVVLGGKSVDGAALRSRADQVSLWSKSLTEDADILLFGCDVGAGPGGIKFVNKLAALTGADVAASDDKTGNAALGGDWVLEVNRGAIEASPFASLSYAGLLDNIDGDANNTPTADRLVSTNRNDILRGKKLDDTYVFTAPFGKDVVIEKAGEGDEDTLDFSAVSSDVTIFVGNNGLLDKITSGANEVTGNAGGDIVNVEFVKGGKGTNLLNLGLHPGPLTVKIQASASSSDGNQVIVLDSSGKVLLTAINVTDIEGSKGDDTFVIEKSATLTGEIDGGTGNNTLSYLIPSATVVADLTANVPGISGNTAATGVKGGITGIRNISSQKEVSQLTGDAAVNKLTGGDADDVFSGGLAADELVGGNGDDTYVFKLADFGNVTTTNVSAGNRDKVTETPAGGTQDTLRFAIPAKVDNKSLLLVATVGDPVATGIQVNLHAAATVGGAVVDRGQLFTSPVKNIEKIEIGEGENIFEFSNTFGNSTNLMIDKGATGDFSAAAVDLDFSNVTSDLMFTLQGDGRSPSLRP